MERLAEAVPGAVRRTLALLAARGEAVAKANATTVLHVRSGRLRASIGSEVEATPTGHDLIYRAGAQTGRGSVSYARLQELGGTVRPVSARYLAIPVGPAKTPAGVSRWASPRDAGFPLRFVPTRSGGLLVRDTGKGKARRSVVYYVLRASVTIPARPYLRPAAEAAAQALPDVLLTELVRGAA